MQVFLGSKGVGSDQCLPTYKSEKIRTNPELARQVSQYARFFTVSIHEYFELDGFFYRPAFDSAPPPTRMCGMTHEMHLRYFALH
jgi:hypothetical protein